MTDRARPMGRLLPWLLISAGLLVFVGANAHLIYVAFSSQPDCVAHVKGVNDDAGYRAAKSAC